MKKILISFALVVSFMFVMFCDAKSAFACEEEINDEIIESEINSSDDASVCSSSSSGDGYYWENTGESLPRSIDYGNGELLNYLKRGDIVFEGMSTTNHSAIVEGIYYDSVYNQYYVRVIESVKNGGVCRGILTPDRMEVKQGEVYRITDATNSEIEGAFDFIYNQLGESYEIAVYKNPSDSNVDWYCSELIWAAFYHQGIYLDDDNNSIVWPAELVDHDFTELVAHYNYSTSCTSSSNTSHVLSCNGSSVYEEHNFINVANGQECVECGYIKATHIHSYTYVSCGDGIHHFKQCSCGYSIRESCIGLSNGFVFICGKCRQEINGDDGPILMGFENSNEAYINNEIELTYIKKEKENE